MHELWQQSSVEAKYGYLWLNKFIAPPSQLPPGFVRKPGLVYDPVSADERQERIYRRIEEEIEREAKVARKCGLTFFVSFNRTGAFLAAQELFEFRQTRVINYTVPVRGVPAQGQIIG